MENDTTNVSSSDCVKFDNCVLDVLNDKMFDRIHAACGENYDDVFIHQMYFIIHIEMKTDK